MIEVLATTKGTLAEGDCACGENYFLPSFSSDILFEDSDGDCACPFPGAMLPRSLFNRNATWKRTDDLYRVALPGSHEIIFSSMGPAGVVVLNKPAQQILDAFANPMAISQVSMQTPSFPAERARQTAHSLVSLGLLTNSGEQRRLEMPKPQTLTAWLHITNACNLHCDYCYLTKTHDSMNVKRGKQAIEAVFRSALAHNFNKVKIKYAGGEPVLNLPVALAVHDYARTLAEKHDLELDGVVLSNGVNISQRAIREIQTRHLRLSISLDGIGQYHDAQRQFANGQGSFDYVERTLDRLSAHGMQPCITITISNRNLDGLPELVWYVLQRRLPFTLNFFRENDCAASFSDLKMQDDKLIMALKKTFAVIETNLPPHSLLNMLADRARLDVPHDRPCGVGHSYLVINQDGGIGRCHMEIEHAVTNITAQDPLGVLTEDTTGLLNLPVDEKEGCRECDWRYWCAGGCPVLTYRATGRFDVKSPNCQIYQAIFPELLRLEGLRLLKYSKKY